MKGDKKMKKIKVLQVGCGKMSKYIMRYVYEKNGEVVGAVDIAPDLIGKDIGEVMETENKGVKISALENLSALLESVQVDVAVVATMSFLNDIEEVVRLCVKKGVNVLTTCEEAFYPENSNPILYRELDSLAKAFNVTITGCGYQDIFWGNMITSICASMQRVTKIKGRSSYNVEDYGLALAKAHGAGLSKEDFQKEIAIYNDMTEEKRNEMMQCKEFFPSYMWNVVGWLCDKLGLHVLSMQQRCVPVIADETLESSTLNMSLPKGAIRGMNAIVECMTKENIVLEVECIGKIYVSSEKDENEWTIYGEPTTTVLNSSPDTVRLTCADVVNRIPQVIKMESGFVPTSRYSEPTFVVKDFEERL